MSAWRGLPVAGAWLGPAVVLSVPALLLQDGTRGLWPPLVLAGGVLLAALVLGGPWGSRLDRASMPLTDLVRRRWPAAGRALVPLAIADLAGGGLFLWAQLAALREGSGFVALALARDDAAGGRAPETPGMLILAVVLVLAVAALGLDGARRIGRLAALFVLVGLVVPLSAVLLGSTARVDRVWAAVAGRSRIVFGEATSWVTAGHPVWSGRREALIAPSEDLRVRLRERHPGRLATVGDEGRWQEVAAGVELTLRPGDRLVVADGAPLRFEAGRRVPGAPASGADWVDPVSPSGDWRAMLGLGATFLLGGLGLGPLHASLPGRPAGGQRAATAGALVAVGGLASVVLWALYAAWLTPEVYLGGIGSAEVFTLPRHVPGLQGHSAWLVLATAGGLVASAIATGGAALGVASPGLLGTPGRARAARLALLALAGVLAAAVPIGAWTVLVAALGLAASAGAPAALLACWSERSTPGSLALGVGVGLTLFAAVGLLDLAASFGPTGPSATGLGWLCSWPALIAAPAATLLAWRGQALYFLLSRRA